MSHSPELPQLILEIVKIGLLRIRALGWSGDARRCAIEADHIHNLPALLANPALELVRYYWDVERPAFISQCSEVASSIEAFEPVWQKLEALMASQSREVLSQ